MALEVGDVFSSRYRADALLGRGGMGEVWSCHDLEERRTVAVKVVLAELLAEPWVQRLFQAEIVAVARLSHAGIVEVYDLLRLPDGASALVMAFRQGKPLDRALRRARTWPVVRTVLTQLLEALAHAHARKVLHLDLKPANILVEVGPAIRTTLVDFGIARVLRPGRGAETWFEDGGAVGTPDYMSPEQRVADVARLGPWSDLYSVGVIAYDLCSGRLPGESSTRAPAPRPASGLLSPAPPLEPDLEGVPEAMAHLCAELLDLDPARRPACAADVLAALVAMDVPATWSVGAPAPARGEEGTDAVATGPTAAPIPTARSSEPGSRTSRTGRIAPPSGRILLSPEAERAFHAEGAPPSPGAYGLFGLRELPVLGRVEERRRLWAAIRSASEEPRWRAVLLTGPAGTGKSRLARDAVERALELGLAAELHTHWSEGGSPDEGLRGLVENALESRGSRGPDFDARLSFFASRHPGEGDAFEREARVLLRPEPDAAPDAGLPVRVAADVIARVAAQRPVVLRLDDAHWGLPEVRSLLAALGAIRTARGVCVVATARVSAGDEAALALAGALRALTADVDDVPMDPLGEEATRSLVRGLLDLDDELAEVVARRSEGNPLFASQLVAQLVRARAVERRGGRYVLARKIEIEKAVPPDMGAVWRRGLAASGADESDLMALALVRDRVSREVVDALASRVGPRFHVSFSRALAAGLVRGEGDLFAFAHGLLRDYLLSRVGGPRAAELHGVAADALAVLVGREDVEEAIARHQHAAGRVLEARASMLSASLWSLRRAERGPRERRLRDLLGWCEGDRDAAEAARGFAELAQFHAEGGQAEAANEAIASARAALARAEAGPARDRAAAWVAFRGAQVARLQARVDEGGLLSREGLEAARRAAEVEVQTLCLAQLGLDGYRRGDHEAARAAYDEGIALARGSGNHATEAQILMMKAAMEPPALACATSRRAAEMARDAGALRIEISARQIEVDALFRAGRRAEALSLGEEVSGIAQRRGLRQIVAMTEGVAACWAAIEGRWEQAARHRDVAAKWGAASGATPERATLAAVEVALALAPSVRAEGPAAEPAEGPAAQLARNRGPEKPGPENQGPENRGPEGPAELRAALEVLVREGRTYRESHFADIVRWLAQLPHPFVAEALRDLDVTKAGA